ncbi:hypothetical protein SDC9_130878 [bioreactor metagenome]|uniref:Uncharacterized protein n=1 Tax=bioreactor metagenome TaxID=1076179 RepID=A0A645D3N9_9ZZZZ
MYDKSLGDGEVFERREKTAAGKGDGENAGDKVETQRFAVDAEDVELSHHKKPGAHGGHREERTEDHYGHQVHPRRRQHLRDRADKPPAGRRKERQPGPAPIVV